MESTADLAHRGRWSVHVTGRDLLGLVAAMKAARKPAADGESGP